MPAVRRPPPIRDLLYYPVTAHVIVLAVLASLLFWAGVAEVEFLKGGFRAWQGEVWRFVTSSLLHDDPVHLFFNLYFLWWFGTYVEERLGSIRMLLICLMIAAGSDAAEYGFVGPSIGLSGINYGLFAMLWVLRSRDWRFADALDRQMIAMVSAVFVICILLTIANVYGVANVAHAAGALIGTAIGLAAAQRRATRALAGWIAVAIVTVSCVLLASPWVRPTVNMSRRAANELAAAGTAALQDGDDTAAVQLLRQAVRMNPREPDWWHNLSLAYHRLGRAEESKEARRRASELRVPMMPKQD